MNPITEKRLIHSTPPVYPPIKCGHGVEFMVCWQKGLASMSPFLHNGACSMDHSLPQQDKTLSLTAIEAKLLKATKRGAPPPETPARDRAAADTAPPVPSAMQPTPVTIQPPLSQTEKIVLRLLLKGLTERRAAEELGRSHNTIHVHTRNIYRKLGVNSRKMLFQLIATCPDIIADTPPRSAAA